MVGDLYYMFTVYIFITERATSQSLDNLYIIKQKPILNRINLIFEIYITIYYTDVVYGIGSNLLMV